MATAASININFGASTAQFERGVKRVSSGLGALRSSVKQMHGTMQMLGNALFLDVAARHVSTAARAIIADFNRIRESADAVGKTSQRLGIAAESLAALRLGAAEAGVASNTLDMALQRMTRRVAEAASGTGEAVKALEELGLSAAVLNSQSPDQTLRDIAQAISQIEGQSNRVRLAFKLFDSEGVALLNMMQDGAAGFDAMRDRADALGLTIKDELIDGIEAMNDSIGLFNTQIDAVKTTLVGAIAPAIKGVLDHITSTSTEMEAISDHFEFLQDVSIAWAGAFLTAFEFTEAAILKGISKIIELTGKAIIGAAVLAQNAGQHEIAAQLLAKGGEFLHVGVLGSRAADSRMADVTSGQFFTDFVENIMNSIHGLDDPPGSPAGEAADNMEKASRDFRKFANKMPDVIKPESDPLTASGTGPAALEANTVGAISAIIQSRKAEQDAMLRANEETARNTREMKGKFGNPIRLKEL